MKSIEEIIRSNLKLVKARLEEGKTDKEIYEEIGVSKTSWNKYKVACSELKALIEEVKDSRNHQVEESLFKLCNGYHYYEEVPTKVKEEVEGETEGVILVKEHIVISNVKKYVKPELAAQKYYLNNKKPTQWKDDTHRVKLDKDRLKLDKEKVGIEHDKLKLQKEIAEKESLF